MSPVIAVIGGGSLFVLAIFLGGMIERDEQAKRAGPTLIITPPPEVIFDDDVEVCVHVKEFADGSRTITLPNAWPFEYKP